MPSSCSSLLKQAPPDEPPAVGTSWRHLAVTLRIFQRTRIRCPGPGPLGSARARRGFESEGQVPAWQGTRRRDVSQQVGPWRAHLLEGIRPGPPSNPVISRTVTRWAQMSNVARFTRPSGATADPRPQAPGLTAAESLTCPIHIRRPARLHERNVTGKCNLITPFGSCGACPVVCFACSDLLASYVAPIRSHAGSAAERIEERPGAASF